MLYRDMHWPAELETSAIKSMIKTLKDSCAAVVVQPELVKSVTELGVGVGRVSRAILEVFPRATLFGISLTDDRDEDLKSHPRMKLFEGDFIEVLGLGKIPPADVVVLKSVGSQHGFEENMDLLARTVGKGILITEGDNRGLFNDSFYDNFELAATVDIRALPGTYVWRGK